MFTSIRWKTFPRDFIIIQVGFLLYGLALALIIQANLGTGAWAVLAVALAEQFGTSPGTMVILSGLLALAAAVLLGEKIGWGTVGNMLFIGPWLDLFLRFIPPVRENIILQLILVLSSIMLVGLASAVYIGVDAGAGPRDSLMLGVKRKTGWPLRRARGVIEILVLSIGWLLGGPVGIGTVIFSLLVGGAVQLGFRVLGVDVGRKRKNPELAEEIS